MFWRNLLPPLSLPTVIFTPYHLEWIEYHTVVAAPLEWVPLSLSDGLLPSRSRDHNWWYEIKMFVTNKYFTSWREEVETIASKELTFGICFPLSYPSTIQILAATTARRLAVVDVERGEQLLAYDNCAFSGRDRTGLAADPVCPNMAVSVAVNGKGLTLLDLRMPLPLDFVYDVSWINLILLLTLCEMRIFCMQFTRCLSWLGTFLETEICELHWYCGWRYLNELSFVTFANAVLRYYFLFWSDIVHTFYAYLLY